jgi:multifunctional methyltransferase subunit TRM112
MKVLTLNFLTCARKSCKLSPAAFPLHPRDVELEQIEVDLNPLFIKNILPRLDWPAMKTLTQELGLPGLPENVPEADALGISEGKSQLGENDAGEGGDDGGQGEGGKEVVMGDAETEPNKLLSDLHTLLLETSIASGKLACGNCGHEYAVKEGIANFLLPSHLV